MTAIAKEVAETSFNDPPKSPVGVLVAPTITTSLIFSPLSILKNRFSFLQKCLRPFLCILRCPTQSRKRGFQFQSFLQRKIQAQMDCLHRKTKNNPSLLGKLLGKLHLQTPNLKNVKFQSSHKVMNRRGINFKSNPKML